MSRGNALGVRPNRTGWSRSSKITGIACALGAVLLLDAGWATLNDAGARVDGSQIITIEDVDTPDRPAAPVDFNREIRPILSNKCFPCHGPDSAARKAGLRLDRFEDAIAKRGSDPGAIVPGDPGASEVLHRVASKNPDVVMPPPELDLELSDEEVALLRRWIADGAQWAEHWSFIPPSRDIQPPALADGNVPPNPIDAFIRARLQAEGRDHADRTDKRTLIRRVTFDLTGMPPTPEEVDAFVNDDSPDAYERVVDRLLASPRYGEHRGRFWLDAARYGDTHGLHLDNLRVMWKYRDWVINALNANMPFDQFIVEQLAGDLLPDPTIDQLIASGFNRCNVTTSEGGAIDAEYLVKYAVDRVETTSTIFLGLTVGCAQCHEHKYDPISQKEFYELYAFFNNTAEAAMDGNAAAPPPVIRVPTPEQTEQLEEIEQKVAGLRAEFDAPSEEIDSAQRAWDAQLRTDLGSMWITETPTVAESQNGASLTILEDGSVIAEGENPAKDVYEFTLRLDGTGYQAIRLETMLDDRLPGRGPGRAHNGNFVLTEIEAEAHDVNDPSNVHVVKFASARADHEQEGAPRGYTIADAIDGEMHETWGWAILGPEHPRPHHAVFFAETPFGFEAGTDLKISLHFASKFASHAIGRPRISVSRDKRLRPSSPGPWHIVGPMAEAASRNDAYNTVYGPEESLESSDWDATFAGEKSWSILESAADGTVVSLDRQQYSATYLARVITSPSARRVGVSLGSDDAVKFWVNGELVHENLVDRPAAADQDRFDIDLREGDNYVVMKIVNNAGGCGFYFKLVADPSGVVPPDIQAMLEIEPDHRTAEQATSIQQFYRRAEWSRGREILAEISAEETRRDEINASIVTTLVSRELPERRAAFLLDRGQYDQPVEQVFPSVPEALPPLPEGAPDNRLGYAQWLIDPRHPLTSRVTVNRIWLQYFGTGLVKTAEDFGSQGEMPTHPDLLDYLAIWFMDSGWDLKALHQLIVTSDTYCQSAKVTGDAMAWDPENRMLARASRYRLDAEMLRDQALFMSGLLVEKMGGPSVKPYQPPGIWEAVGYTDSNTARFTQDMGEALYRRSLYTFWKRTAPPPSMSTFDAPSRETCTVRRERTNTPLGALVLMNDIQFVEAARHMAERVIREGGDTVESRVRFGFLLATAREPDAHEIDVIAGFYAEQHSTFAANIDAGTQLLSTGDSGRDESLDVPEHAAWTMVCNLLLNLDEAITKG